MVSADDYNTVSLKINGNSEGMISTVSLGAEVRAGFEEPKISQTLVEYIISILPQGCAVDLQESNTTCLDMYLVTDSGLKPGRYI